MLAIRDFPPPVVQAGKGLNGADGVDGRASLFNKKRVATPTAGVGALVLSAVVLACAFASCDKIDLAEEELPKVGDELTNVDWDNPQSEKDKVINTRPKEGGEDGETEDFPFIPMMWEVKGLTCENFNFSDFSNGESPYFGLVSLEDLPAGVKFHASVYGYNVTMGSGKIYVTPHNEYGQTTNILSKTRQVNYETFKAQRANGKNIWLSKLNDTPWIFAMKTAEVEANKPQ